MGRSGFNPFFSVTNDCTWLFGNDVAGLTANDFGRWEQYGKPNLPWFFGILSSAEYVPTPAHDEEADRSDYGRSPQRISVDGGQENVSTRSALAALVPKTRKPRVCRASLELRD
ncbi:MAG TPA: hypothetical protein VGC78_07215 [Gaiellaceae bacterium]